MNAIAPSPNKEQWPRQACPSVECRKRDLVIRIADWRRDRDEPGYDVECYIAGVYDWNESQHFRTKPEAVAYAAAQIAKLL